MDRNVTISTCAHQCVFFELAGNSTYLMTKSSEIYNYCSYRFHHGSTSSRKYFSLDRSSPPWNGKYIVAHHQQAHLVSCVAVHADASGVDIVRYSEDAGHRVRVDQLILAAAEKNAIGRTSLTLSACWHACIAAKAHVIIHTNIFLSN